MRPSATRYIFVPIAMGMGSQGVDSIGDRRGTMHIRFYLDSTTGLPHISRHNLEAHEVGEVLERPREDRPGSAFVITAMELSGKPLAAYRRRLRRKQR